jgi:imidazoleglycerol phosphate dehydratase HisB
MCARKAKVSRATKETKIVLEINLDGTGKSSIKTPLNFLNHMLENFAKHSRFDLTIKASGDIEVEDHHLIEDIGLCLGEAFDKALGNRKGIARMASIIVPFDDSLATCAVDIGGRPYASIEIPYSEFKDAKIGDTTKENIPHFFESFASKAKLNLYLNVVGKNDHHKIESCFKALAKALLDATRVTGKGVPSTKGVI